MIYSVLFPSIIFLLANVFLESSSAWSWGSNHLLRDKSISNHKKIDSCIDRRGVLQIVGASSLAGIFAQRCEANAATHTTSTTASTPPNTARNGGKKIFFPTPGSLAGKVIVITGATSGLGLESAKRLAAAGGTILMTARSESKGETAVREVQQYLNERSVENSNVYATTLDLSDFDSIKSFPKRYDNLLGSKKIDVLMNNAGVAAIPEREITKDGFERTFQTNHLGPFMLTALLFPYLNREGEVGSRIINVASIAHNLAKIHGTDKNGLDIDNLNSELEYSLLGWGAYGQSKLENILFTQELQRRVDVAGLDWLSVTALHPGVVATDIWRNTYVGMDRREKQQKSRIRSIASNLFYDSTLPVEEGANSQVMLAAFGEKGFPVKGQYIDYDMKLKRLDDFAKDAEIAQYLWRKSEEYTGISFIIE